MGAPRYTNILTSRVHINRDLWHKQPTSHWTNKEPELYTNTQSISGIQSTITAIGKSLISLLETWSVALSAWNAEHSLTSAVEEDLLCNHIPRVLLFQLLTELRMPRSLLPITTTLDLAIATVLLQTLWVDTLCSDLLVLRDLIYSGRNGDKNGTQGLQWVTIQILRHRAKTSKDLDYASSEVARKFWPFSSTWSILRPCPNVSLFTRDASSAVRRDA